MLSIPKIFVEDLNDSNPAIPSCSGMNQPFRVPLPLPNTPVHARPDGPFMYRQLPNGMRSPAQCWAVTRDQASPRVSAGTGGVRAFRFRNSPALSGTAPSPKHSGTCTSRCPFMFRKIAKRYAMTGSTLVRYARAGQPPGFKRTGVHTEK